MFPVPTVCGRPSGVTPLIAAETATLPGSLLRVIATPGAPLHCFGQ